MLLKTQIIISVIIIFGMLGVLQFVKKGKLELKYALPWLVVSMIVLTLTTWPGLLNGLSKALGIAVPSNMLFFMGFCFSLGIVFSLTVAVSRLSFKIKILTQKMGLLEKEMREWDRRKEKEEDESRIYTNT